MSSSAATMLQAAPSARSVTLDARLAAMLIAFATLVIRGPIFGDPNYHVDEVFYLLVGKQMHLGALPYVDIWDRKPLGLFIIYYLIAGLGGSGVLQFQLVAAAFAFATAFTLYRVVVRIAPPLTGVLCAVVYLAALEALAGGGGQSPIFYNLFIANAVLATMKAWTAPDARKFNRYALVAMALCGTAIFVKQTAVVESIYLGMALLVRRWKMQPQAQGLVRSAATFMALGIAPTLTAFLFYAATGHAAEFWFANFQSIFLKQGPTSEALLRFANYLILQITPLLLSAAAGYLFLRRQPPSSDRDLLSGWFFAAFAGFFLIPNFYDHYALPVATALAVTSAPLFSRPLTGPVCAALTTLWLLAAAAWPAFERTAESRANFDRMIGLIRANGGDRSLYVFDGTPLLYAAAGAPLPTTRPFPEHISSLDERGATGIDQMREFNHIMGQRPRVIIKRAERIVRTPNLEVRAALDRQLHDQYRLAATVPMTEFAFTQKTELWVLNGEK